MYELLKKQDGLKCGNHVIYFQAYTTLSYINPGPLTVEKIHSQIKK